MSSASKKLSKPATVTGFTSNSLLKPPSSKPSRTTSSLLGTSNGTNGSLLQSKNKAQSQEDLTKVKDRTTRSKNLTGGSNLSSGNRRPTAGKESQKVDKSRDKTKPSSAKSNSSSTSSSSRSSSLLTRKTKDASRNKEPDKVGLEAKIRDLMVLAKNKDSEIRSLRTKLDQMMTLINRQHGDDVNTSRKDFAGLVKLSDDHDDDDQSSVQEITRLKNENMRLKEEVDSMMIKVKDAEKPTHLLHQQKLAGYDLEALSNEDALSSSLDDLASASSGDALRSMSRSTSTENLLDDVSTSGTTSSNGGAGGRGDERNTEDVSESSSVTVACLTERIHRMEESHISTNEELEATVQELNDLQMSVPELTIDNNRLRQQKDFLEEKLLKTEKRLQDQTSEASHLRALVSDRFSDASDHSELQQQYLVLLNEREQLIRIQESANQERQIAATEKKQDQELIEALQERMRHLERELDQSNTDKSMLDKRLKTLKDVAEEEHLKMMKKLEEELQSERQHNENLLKMSSNPKDVAEVVEALRNENQELESRFLLLEEEYSQCQNENEKLDERVAELEEEQEAADAKSKRDLSELSELIDRLQEDLRIKQASLDEANDTLFVMEDSIEQHIAVKKHDNHIIQQLQNQISSLKEERFRLEKEIQQLKKEQRSQSEEWKQFQTDLQMAVMIANDMKAETQDEVLRLREENQALDEQITKLRVENEQLRRKTRISNVSATSASILEAVALRQSSSRTSADMAALRENYKRRTSENSPGVQSLIKSFDSQSPSTETPSPLSPLRTQPVSPAGALPPDSPTVYTPVKPSKITPPSCNSPITATVSPIQRHPSMSSMTQQQVVSPSTSSIVSKLHPSATSSTSSKPGTPDSGRSVPTSDHSQTSLLRRNSGTQESRNSETRKQPMTDVLDRVSRHQAPSTASTRHRTLSLSTSSGDALTSLARKYGGSKRNALLKWCQEKTSGYTGIDITNFSSSWSDGLALCALLHSYLPAHIPYESLRQTYVTAADDATRQQLQAKNFRLAFAAAESVGIDPTLTKDEMTTKERPDWQRVMAYVTQIYKYFET